MTIIKMNDKCKCQLSKIVQIQTRTSYYAVSKTNHNIKKYMRNKVGPVVFYKGKTLYMFLMKTILNYMRQEFTSGYSQRKSH